MYYDVDRDCRQGLSRAWSIQELDRALPYFSLNVPHQRQAGIKKAANRHILVIIPTSILWLKLNLHHHHHFSSSKRPEAILTARDLKAKHGPTLITRDLSTSDSEASVTVL
jgi:hypothetical protein